MCDRCTNGYIKWDETQAEYHVILRSTRVLLPEFLLPKKDSVNIKYYVLVLYGYHSNILKNRFLNVTQVAILVIRKSNNLDTECSIVYDLSALDNATTCSLWRLEGIRSLAPQWNFWQVLMYQLVKRYYLCPSYKNFVGVLESLFGRIKFMNFETDRNILCKISEALSTGVKTIFLSCHKMQYK